MKNWFKSLKIRYKILFGFLLLAILNLIFALFVNTGTNRVTNIYLPARANIKSLTSSIKEMQLSEKNFLISDVHNPSNSLFFEDEISTSKSKYKVEYDNALKKVIELQNYEIAVNIPEENRLSSEIKVLLLENAEKFYSLSTLYKELGFKDFGLEGEMRNYAYLLENKLNEKKDYQSQVLLLKLRRSEKDYLLRKEDIYVNDFLSLYSELEVILKDQDEMKYLHQYKESFLKLVAIENKIGTSPTEGIRGELLLTILQLEPLLEESEEIVLNSTLKEINTIKYINLSVAILLFIISIYISIYLSRAFTLPIEKLKNAVSSLKQGEDFAPINVTSKDEIGGLAVAFNKMGVNLRNSYNELKKFQQAVEAATEGVIITDKNQNIVYINPATEVLFNIKPKDALEKDVRKIFIDSKKTNKKSLKEFENNVNKGNVLITDDIYGKTSDNRTFPMHLSIYPLKENRKIKFFVGLVEDITKRKEVEQAKNEFVSLASHQLRTPLSTINWYTEMLLNEDVGKVTKEQKNYLSEVYTASNRMVELVNSLLNVSRLDLGTFMVEPEKIDLKEIAKDILNELKLNIKEKNLTIKESYDKDLPIILADKKLTRIIFLNLLSNAVKYTPLDGKVSLSVNKKGKNIEIHVSDTGIGIPKKQQDQMFTKLFRADNAKSSDSTGTGLGLYIVKSIMNNIGGKIWFESKEGKGTKFYVEFPLSGMKKKDGTKQINE